MTLKLLLPFTASIKPSLTSIPKPEPPPDKVVIIPTLSLCPSAKIDDDVIIISAANVVVNFFIYYPLNS